MEKILVCPVAYNEYPKLKKVLERIVKVQKKYIMDCAVVNDGSTDATHALLKQYRRKGIMSVTHSSRMGVGAAIRSAIYYAIKNKYTILVVMAGNNKDNPEEIKRLVTAIKEGYDIAQGSRYLVKQKNYGHFPLHRQFATRLHPFFMSLFLRRKLTDTTNGFRAMRVSLFNNTQINIDQSWLDAYELEPYILFKAISLGYAVTEVPVTKVYPVKSEGFTKMKPLVGWWSIVRPIVYLGFGIRS